ncbi:bifunctional ADP-dependent NAD(P)H-hydrate dehydratase/NAD(P)H-hydrate epimerase [Massilibacterium senegalense]|uniref:bifunctional ADP-dependent NAD(P)H-hydrate dehydratase/NAD(P)H-hydrate epimerase n=1 Tax=Massilibacterium senegalense TaxID=1632858 RepID=UPI0007864B09|nr:bifunctional ADP-dependent NAD(P)H-hydrate dehydratase/NAD(P)H-hydrate epimerase [Massilibacterium senegalense]
MQIVTAEEMYAIDGYTMEEIGIHGPMLMENAGQSLVFHLLSYLKKEASIMVVIGMGNNGGDGFVVSRQLQTLGYSVDTWVMAPLEKLKGDALFHYHIYTRSGYTLYALEKEGMIAFEQALANHSFVIDAMLGIGVSGEIRSPYKEIIPLLNQAKAKVYAIDTPSGISANSGNVEMAVKATMTFTIQCYKRSAFLYPARDFYGQVIVCPIGIPEKAEYDKASACFLWDNERVQATLPTRQAYSHKGTYGKVLVVGGSNRMSGAVMMTTKSVLKAGAGLTTVAVPASIRPVLASHITEAMFIEAKEEKGYFAQELDVSFELFDTIVAGPGMGRESGCEKVVKQLLAIDRPLVLDADALFFVATQKEVLKMRQSPTVLTPHTGEMARLTGYDVSYINEHRFEVAKEFATTYQTYVLLKGPYTIVATPTGQLFVNPTGNAALAKGGSGDVLSGIIAAFLHQHEHVQHALSNACYLHGSVADDLVQLGYSPLSVVASDIIHHVPQMLAKISQS